MKCKKCGQPNAPGEKICGSCGAPLHNPEKLASGHRIINGRFEIEKMLGQGGFADVFLAKDSELSRKVAVKRIPKEILATKFSKEFLKEARAASQLKHNNICTIYEIYEDEDNNYIVMEYIDGHTLNHIIQSRKLSLEEILYIAIRICEGMEHAHSNKIIHLDINSSNIMIDKRGNVKILDFGLAKLTDTSLSGVDIKKSEKPIEIGISDAPEVKVISGTIPYMSPEQTMGIKLDNRSDIFSFGIILYEMIEGRKPFPGTTKQEIIHNIQNKQVEISRKVPGELKQIVEKCLEKNIRARYQSFSEIKKALEEVEGAVKGGDRPSKISKISDARFQILDSKWREESLSKEKKNFSLSKIFTGSRFFKIVLPLVFMILTAVVIIIFMQSSNNKKNSKLAKDSKKTYICVHPMKERELSNQSSEKDHEKINYLTEMSLSLFKEFIVINDRTDRICDRFDVKYILGINIESLPVKKDEVDESKDESQSQYAIRAELELVTRGKKEKAGSISSPFSDRNKILMDKDGKAGAVDFLTRRVHTIIFNKSDDRNNVKIHTVFGSNWQDFSNFYEGYKLYNNFQYPGAKIYFSKSLELPASRLLLSKIFYFDGETKQAQKELDEIFKKNKSIDVFPEFFRFDLQFMQARLKFDLKNEIKFLEELQKKFPFSRGVLFEFGETYFHHGKAEKAINYYNQALELDKNYKKALNHMGYCYSYMGQHGKALEKFEEYNREEPANSYDSLGDGYFYRGDLDAAERMKLTALKINDKDLPWVYLGLADIYILRAEFNKAQDILEKHRQIAPSAKNQARSFAKDAYIYYLKEDYKTALSVIDKSLKTYDPKPEDIYEHPVAEAHWLKGIILLAMGRDKESKSQWVWLGNLMKMYSISPDNFYIPYKYFRHLEALLQERGGEIEQSKAILRELVKMKTQLSYWVTQFHYQFFYTEYVKLLKRNGGFEEAIKEVDICLGFNPNYIPALWEKAEILEKLGKKETAFKVYSRIKKLYGKSTENNIFREKLEKKLSRK